MLYYYTDHTKAELKGQINMSDIISANICVSECQDGSPTSHHVNVWTGKRIWTFGERA
jgi:hypothetical protein